MTSTGQAERFDLQQQGMISVFKAERQKETLLSVLHSVSQVY